MKVICFRELTLLSMRWVFYAHLSWEDNTNAVFRSIWSLFETDFNVKMSLSMHIWVISFTPNSNWCFAKSQITELANNGCLKSDHQWKLRLKSGNFKVLLIWTIGWCGDFSLQVWTEQLGSLPVIRSTWAVLWAHVEPYRFLWGCTGCKIAPEQI